MDDLIKENNKNLFLFLDNSEQNILKDEASNKFKLLDNILFLNLNISDNCSENEFIEVEVPSDGACLFTCFSIGMDLNITGKLFKEYLLKQYVNENFIFKDLKEILKSNLKWGNSDTITWFSSLFKISVCVHLYSANGEKINFIKYGKDEYKTIHLKLKDQHFSFLKKNNDLFLIDLQNTFNENLFNSVKIKLDKYKNENPDIIIFKNIFYKENFFNRLNIFFEENKDKNVYNLVLYNNKKGENTTYKSFQDVFQGIKRKNNFNFYLDQKIIYDINKFILENKDKYNFEYINVLSIKNNLYVKDIINTNYNDHVLMDLQNIKNFVNYKIDDSFNLFSLLDKKTDFYFLENIILKIIYKDPITNKNKTFNIFYIFNEKIKYFNKYYEKQRSDKPILKNIHYLQNTYLENKKKLFNILVSMTEDLTNVSADILYFSTDILNIINNTNIEIFNQKNILKETFSDFNNFNKNQENLLIEENTENNLIDFFSEDSIDLNNKCDLRFETNDKKRLKKVCFEDDPFILEDEYENTKKRKDCIEDNNIIEEEIFKEPKTTINKPSYIIKDGELYFLKYNKYYVKSNKYINNMF